jgi:MFS transporter, DHA1 family, inner membrane transport protein
MIERANQRNQPTYPASSDPSTPHWRAHAIALAFGTFAVGTDAFVVAGVLPSIASSLRVTTAAAGQLVTVFALAYALASPVLSALTADWSRRTTLVVALAAFAIGNAITAMVPSFTLVLASRVIAAAGAGLFTANATATAAMFSGSRYRGRAIAIVLLGLTSSLVLGAPLGAAIGNAAGWRMTMWFVTLLGLCSGAVILLRLPDVREGERSGLTERLAPLRSPVVLYDLLRAVIIFTGIYIPYTYISVVYAPVTRAEPQWLDALLLSFGVAGTVGNLLAGRMADRLGPVSVMIGAAIGLAATFALVPLVNTAVPSALMAAALSGLFSFALNAPQQHFLISHAAGQKISFVTSLYQSTIYAAVSLSGAVGAIAIRAGLADKLALLAVMPVFLFILMTWFQGRREIRKEGTHALAGIKQRS